MQPATKICPLRSCSMLSNLAAAFLPQAEQGLKTVQRSLTQIRLTAIESGSLMWDNKFIHSLSNSHPA